MLNEDKLILDILYEKKEALKKQITDIDLVIQKRIGNSNSFSQTEIIEPKNEITSDAVENITRTFTIDQMVKQIFVDQKKFLFHKQVVDLVLQKYPATKDWYTDLPNKISTSLNKYKKKATLTSHKIGISTKNYVWGSPQWLDAQGKIRRGHEYDRSYLSGIDDTEDL